MESEFLDLACLRYGDDAPERRRQAARLSAENPSLERASILTAAATGHCEALRSFLAEDRADRSGGPRQWPPLLYLCYSRVPARDADYPACLRLLLEAGADPDAYWMWGDTYRFTALTGVFGEGEQGPDRLPPHPDCEVLARMLLEAGADPNDSQALYNRMFTPENRCLEILLEAGLNPAHRNNWEGENATRTLDYQLCYAAKSGFDERVALLLEHGADPEARDGDGSRVYQLAARRGYDAITTLFEQHGANPDLTAEDRFWQAVMRSDAETARALVEDNPQILDTLGGQQPCIFHECAGRGHTECVDLLLDLGWPVNAPEPGGNRASALHYAGLHGRTETARLLLERGADIRFREPTYGASPLGWANYKDQHETVAFLLDTEIDVFDAIEVAGPERLAALLEKEPEQIHATLGPSALSPLQVAEELGKSGHLAVLERAGAG